MCIAYSPQRCSLAHIWFACRQYLSGPIEVEGAKTGDLLKVEFLNLGPLDGDEWGFTGTFAKENGGGFLTDHFPRASKVSARLSYRCVNERLHMNSRFASVRPVGTSKGSIVRRGTSLVSSSPGSFTLVLSALPRATSFWRSGTNAKAHSSPRRVPKTRRHCADAFTPARLPVFPR